MPRFHAAAGPALRLLAVAVLGLAAAELRWAESGSPDVAAPDPREFYSPNPERVAVRVDGWVIEVDGVASQPLPPAVTVPHSPPALARVAYIRSVPRPSASLSRYDQLIHWHAASHGLDWRLVTALIEEESGFKETAVSAKGAIGLMQVRPIAAEDVGETEFESPSDNIRTGVRYLKRLDSMFGPSAVGRDRLALVLAAYNMGPAHVQDAQVLARNFGFDPLRWDNAMATIVPLLEDPRFYQRVPSGFASGRSVVAYVERILDRYDRFKIEAGETPGLAGPSPQAASARG